MNNNIDRFEQLEISREIIQGEFQGIFVLKRNEKKLYFIRLSNKSILVPSLYFHKIIGVLSPNKHYRIKTTSYKFPGHTKYKWVGLL